MNSGNFDVSKLLLEKGADPELFLKKRLSIREVVVQYWTPIHIAASKNYIDILQLFIDSGYSPNIQNNTGITPLHVAAAQKSCDAIKMLIENGADVALCDMDNEPPLFPGISNKLNFDILKLLITGETAQIENTSRETCLHIAARVGYADAISYLIEYGANVHACDEKGNTPLHAAVVAKQKESVKLLLEHDADPLCRNNENMSPYVLCTGNISGLLKNYVENKKDQISAKPVDKSPRSTRTAPSRLRTTLSPSQSPLQSPNNTQKLNLSRTSDRSPMSPRSMSQFSPYEESPSQTRRKRPQPPSTVREYQNRIEMLVKDTGDSIKSEIEQLRKLINDLKTDMEA